MNNRLCKHMHEQTECEYMRDCKYEHEHIPEQTDCEHNHAKCVNDRLCEHIYEQTECEHFHEQTVCMNRLSVFMNRLSVNICTNNIFTNSMYCSPSVDVS